MKKIIILVSTIMFILTVVTVMAFRNPEPKKAKKIDITGTWQLDKYRYGDVTGMFVSATADHPHIKLITGNRFLWVLYDSSTKKIMESAGGSYTLDGNTYTESIDYGYAMDSYLGTVSKFNVNVEDGMLFLTGYIGNGYRIEEIWRKVE